MKTFNQFMSEEDYDKIKDYFPPLVNLEVETFKRFLWNSLLESNKNENIQWIFIGDGRFKRKMEKLLFRQIKSRKVIFLPQQKYESLPSWVIHADFLYLSLNNSKLFTQTVPAKLQGYMAMEKPIIGMISGEAATIISEAECGFSSFPGDALKLNELVNKVLDTSQEYRKCLGENGRDFYNKNFPELKVDKSNHKLH